jgi:hypothetical protein
MTENDQSIEVLIGLLDFHSDRATAHASFVIASIFGIFTLLFSFKLFNGLIWGKVVYVLAFILLNAISVYSYLNFGYYAAVADNVRETLNSFIDENIKSDYEKLMCFRKKKYPIFDQFANLNSKEWWKRLKHSLFFAVWYFSIAVPFIWIFFEDELIVKGALITSIIIFPLIYFLVMKKPKFCQNCKATNEADAKYCCNCEKPLS